MREKLIIGTSSVISSILLAFFIHFAKLDQSIIKSEADDSHHGALKTIVFITSLLIGGTCGGFLAKCCLFMNEGINKRNNNDIETSLLSSEKDVRASDMAEAKLFSMW